jgi:hypothetical protein
LFDRRLTWTPEQDKLLGTAPDAEIARRFGRKTRTVEKRRLALGIPSNNPAYHQWTPDEDALLGTMPDRELARRLGVSLIAVVARRQRKHILSVEARRPWAPEDDRLLGTMADAELAEKLGRTEVAVAIRRRALRIAVFAPKPPPVTNVSVTDNQSPMKGKPA